MPWDTIDYDPFTEEGPPKERAVLGSDVPGTNVSLLPEDRARENQIDLQGPTPEIPSLPTSSQYDPFAVFARSPQRKEPAEPNYGLLGKSFGVLTPDQQQSELAKIRQSAENDLTSGEQALKTLPKLYADRPEQLTRDLGDIQRTMREARKTIAEIDAGTFPLPTKTPLRAGVENAVTGLGNVAISVPEQVGIIKGYLQPGAVDDETLLNWSLGAKDYLRRQFPGDPARQRDFSQQLASGLGQIAAFYGAGAVAALLKAGVAATTAVVATLGSTATGTQGFEEATRELEAAKARAKATGDAQTVTELDRLLKTLGYSAVGVTEAAPIARTLSRAVPPPGTRIGERLLAGAEGGLEEAAQESGSQVAQNLITQRTTDPNRATAEGVAESGAVGGTLGFLVNALMPGRGGVLRSEPGAETGFETPEMPPLLPAPEGGEVYRGPLQTVEPQGSAPATEAVTPQIEPPARRLPAPGDARTQLRNEVERQIRANPDLAGQAGAMLGALDSNAARPAIDEAIRTIEDTGQVSFAAHQLLPQLRRDITPMGSKIAMVSPQGDLAQPGTQIQEQYGVTPTAGRVHLPSVETQTQTQTQPDPFANVEAAPLQDFEEPLFALAPSQKEGRQLDELGLYSKALEEARNLPQPRGTPEQLLAQLERGGAKEAEIRATNLDQFLFGEDIARLRRQLVDLQQRVNTIQSELSNKQRQPELTPEERAALESELAQLQPQIQQADQTFRTALQGSNRPRSIKKEDLVDYLDRNQVRLQQIVYGGGDEANIVPVTNPVYFDDGSYEIEYEDRQSGDRFIVNVDDDAGNVTVQGPDGQLIPVDAPLNQQGAGDAVRAIENWLEDRRRAQMPEEVEGPAQWQAYSLDPGNPTYRETVVQIPPVFRDNVVPDPKVVARYQEEWDDLNRKINENIDSRNGFSPQNRALEEERETLHRRMVDETIAENPGRLVGELFQESHWDLPNVVVHNRTQQLKTTDGREVLNLDESQSTWGERLREGGTRDEVQIGQLEAQIANIENHMGRVARRGDELILDHWENLDGLAEKSRWAGRPNGAFLIQRLTEGVWGDGYPNIPGFPTERRISAYEELAMSTTDNELGGTLQQLAQRLDALRHERALYQAELSAAQSGVTAHPLVRTTDQWLAVGLRNFLKRAVKADVDGVTITPGDVQIDRYRLSRVASGAHITHLSMSGDLRRVDLIAPGPGGSAGAFTVDQDKKVVGESGIGDQIVGQHLNAVVGENVANSIMEAKDGQNIDFRELEIGGNAMREAYDKIYPRALAKILRQYDKGIKPEKVQLRNHNGRIVGQSIQMMGGGDIRENPPTDFIFFPLTEKFKAAFLEKGAPVFALAGTGAKEAELFRLNDNDLLASVNLGAEAMQTWISDLAEHYGDRPWPGPEAAAEAIGTMVATDSTTAEQMQRALSAEGFETVPDPLLDQGLLAVSLLSVGRPPADEMLFALSGFYSAPIKAVEEAKQEKATPEQWKKILQGPGIRQEQVRIMGVMDWLDEQASMMVDRPGSNAPKSARTIDKDTLLAFMRAHDFELNEKILRSEPPEGDEPSEQEAMDEDERDDWIRERADEIYQELEAEAIGDQIAQWEREHDPDDYEIAIDFDGTAEERDQLIEAENIYNAAIESYRNRGEIFGQMPLPGLHQSFPDFRAIAQRHLPPETFEAWDADMIGWLARLEHPSYAVDDEDIEPRRSEFFSTRQEAEEAAHDRLEEIRENHLTEREDALQGIYEQDFAVEWDEASRRAEEEWEDQYGDGRGGFRNETRYKPYAIEGGKRYTEILLPAPDLARQGYRSQHFQDSEIVHTRFDERRTQDEENSKTLLIHEIQSDLIQGMRGFGSGAEGVEKARAARRENGWTPELREQAQKIKDDLEQLHVEFNRLADRVDFDPEGANAQDLLGRIQQGQKAEKEVEEKARKIALAAARYMSRFGSMGGAPENVPYQGNAWWELGFKAALDYAVKNGYDGIALTRPEQIRKATYTPEDVAEKFYGENVPRFISKYLKKWGSKPERRFLSGIEGVRQGNALREGLSRDDVVLFYKTILQNISGSPHHELRAEKLSQTIQKLTSPGVWHRDIYPIISMNGVSEHYGMHGYQNPETGERIAPILEKKITGPENLYWPITEAMRKDILETGQALALTPDPSQKWRTIHAMLKMGRSVPVTEENSNALFALAEPFKSTIPQNWGIYNVSRFDPIPGNPKMVKATFKTKEGRTQSFDLLAESVRRGAVFTYAPRVPLDVGQGQGPRSDPGIFFLHFSGPSIFPQGFRGKLRHEITHVLRYDRRFSPRLWRQLVGHAGDLQILDFSLGAYFDAVGDRANPDDYQMTIGQAYKAIYKNNPRLQENLDQEAVAHMVELYDHGVLTPQQVGPVRHIVDAILNGDFAKGKPGDAAMFEPVPTEKVASPEILSLLKEEANAVQRAAPSSATQAGQRAARAGQNLSKRRSAKETLAPGREELARSGVIGRSFARRPIEGQLWQIALKDYLADYWKPGAALHRAKLQGFTLPAWHATTAEDFLIPDPLRRESDFGFHMATGTPEAANWRAGYHASKLGHYELAAKTGGASMAQYLFNFRPDAHVLPLLVKVKNPLRWKDIGSWRSPINWKMSGIEILTEGILDVNRNKRVQLTDINKNLVNDIVNLSESNLNLASADADQIFVDDLIKLFEDHGYDGVVYENAIEDPGKDSLFVWDASRVRSAFDMFDARANGQPGLYASVPYMEANLRDDLNAAVRQAGLEDDIVFAMGGLTPEGQPLLSDPKFKRWFKKSKVVDVEGQPLAVYTGAKRGERIAERGMFDPARATSGPLAYFTDSPELASNYSQNKPDTSLDTSDLTQFFHANGQQGFDAIWRSLSASDRMRINREAWKIGYDKDDDTYHELPEDNRQIPKGHWELMLREARRNGLRALWSIWYEGGFLVFNEGEFTQIMEAVGIKDPRYDDPDEARSTVFPVYLSIQNPLYTYDVPDQVVQALEAEAHSPFSRPDRTLSSGDIWDKNNRDPVSWVEELKNAVAKGENSHVWTSIPDWVTQTLVSLGYDGIIDSSGKGGGEEHAVYIPFYPEQIKSALSNKGYDPDNPDITFALAGGGGPDQRLIMKALRQFGRTDEPMEAGYILPDGEMLDFSGRSDVEGGYRWNEDAYRYEPMRDRDEFAGHRLLDHRQLGDLVEESGTKAMREFMERTGAVRYQSSTGGFEAFGLPTNAQLRQILRAHSAYHRGEPMPVDWAIPREDGYAETIKSEEIERPTLEKLKAFFSEPPAEEDMTFALAPTPTEENSKPITERYTAYLRDAQEKGVRPISFQEFSGKD